MNAAVQRRATNAPAVSLGTSRMLTPQPGPQEQFLASPADIVIYGGAAGGGKTYGLLLECIRNVDVEDFGAVVFRRVSTQITSQGGLWDTSQQIYPLTGATPVSQPRPMWRWKSGARVTFAHLQNDRDVRSWQGSQIPLICWDELTHFTEYQFFYMLSRNRSASGVAPYMRATCNPDADSWVAKLIAWWIDQETGYPRDDRIGLIRYFSRIGNEMIWGDTRSEVLAQVGNMLTDEMAAEGITPDDLVKSITFIPSKLTDNKALLAKDPAYFANLLALPKVERERLLGGNWKIRVQGGDVFPRGTASIIPAVPTGVVHWVRAWDLAATEPSDVNPDPDATAGVLMGFIPSARRYVIANVVRAQVKSSKVRQLMMNTAALDAAAYGHVTIFIAQDPGQAGKDQAQNLVAMLAGYAVSTERESGDKEVRAEPLSAQWQVGNVDLVAGDWNVAFIDELDAFPGGAGHHDDQVDAASGAFRHLTAGLPLYDSSMNWV